MNDDAAMNNVGPVGPAFLPLIVMFGSPALVFRPAIVMPDRVMGGSRDVRPMVLPASAGANLMVCGPAALFAAVIASRSEMPSGPGLALSACGLAVLPLTTSLTFDTTRTAARAGAAINDAIAPVIAAIALKSQIRNVMAESPADFAPLFRRIVKPVGEGRRARPQIALYCARILQEDLP